ncbi:MAG: glycosyltransferase family 1 protein [Patescibacteria group bacterium]|nr:glycosyltransferase family 1 protein [Patescibacteria group bacterium]
MRIGIDARFYGPVGKGLGRYTQEMIDQLIKLDRSNEYVIFLRRENFSACQTDNPKVKKVLVDIKWYGWAEQIIFPFYILAERLDMMHFLHFNVPVLCPVKFLVTIHDLILLKFPTRRATTLSPLIYALKNFFYKIVIYSAVKRARGIFAVSAFTKKELLSRFRIRPEKIIVTYEGVPEFFLAAKKINQSAAGTLEKYNIAQPYLLYVGNAYPHKNLEGLINVFASLNHEQPALRLILVGKEDYFYRRLKQLVKSLGENIIFPGYVPDADLKILYSEALAYVFPSFYEGFGLPPLEAMAFGLPVVSSNKTCLPEILGQAAIYFNPESEKEMREKIELVINDQNLRQELKGRGLEQIKKYSWGECAEKTLQAYKNNFKK